jgi:hypothetical protein
MRLARLEQLQPTTTKGAERAFSIWKPHRIRELHLPKNSRPDHAKSVHMCMGRAYHRYRLRAAAQTLRRRHNLPLALYCGGQRIILAAISKHSSRTQWSLTLPTRRAPAPPARPIACSRSVKNRLQWVRLEMAASLCSPVHRGPHGSLLLADPII